MEDTKKIMMLNKLRNPSLITKGRCDFDVEITEESAGGYGNMTLPEALNKILRLDRFLPLNSGDLSSRIQDDCSSFWKLYLRFYNSSLREYVLENIRHIYDGAKDDQMISDFINGEYSISEFMDLMTKVHKISIPGCPLIHGIAGCVLSVIEYITSNVSTVQGLIYEYYKTDKASKNDEPSELQTMPKPESTVEAVAGDMIFGDKHLPDILAADDVINGEYMRATKNLYTNTDPDMWRFWKTYLDTSGNVICEDIINRRNITDVIMIAELRRFISGESTVHSLEDVITKRLSRKDPKHQLLVFKDYIKSYILTNMDKIALVQTAHMESKSANTPGRLSLYDLVIFWLTKTDVNGKWVDDPGLYTEKKIIIQNWGKILNTFFIGHAQNHAHSAFASFVGKDGLQPIDFDGSTLNYDDFCNVSLFMQEFKRFCDHVVIFVNNYIHDQIED